MGIFDRFSRKSEPVVTPPIVQGKSPEELAAVMRDVLGRLDELNSAGRVKGWLGVKKVKEAELAGWLRENGAGFSGEELGQLRRFVGVMNGVLEVAAREVLSRLPPPPVDESEITRSDAENNESEMWLDRGNEQGMAGDLAGSIISFDRALQINPDNHEAWYGRGVILDSLGQYEAAIASYDQALKIKPDKHEAWNNRGAALYDLSQYETAITSFDMALQINSDDQETWNNRGFVLYDLGQYEAAIASYGEAIRINSVNHTSWSNRGIALYDLGQYEAAIASFDIALQTNLDDHASWSNRGLALAHLGQYEAAITSCDQALQIKSAAAAAHNNRGFVLYGLGRYEAAIMSYDQALQTKPDFHEAWFNRGNTLKKLGQYEAAITSYDQALQIKPDFHEAWFNRGSAAFSGRGKGLPNTYTLKHPELNQRGYPGELASLTIGLTYCPAPLAQGYLHRAIGNAHWDHARTQASPRPYWREALKAYNLSLQSLTAAEHPEERLQTLQKLIRTCIALNEIPAARHYQTEGIALFQQLRATAHNKRQFEAKFSDFIRTEIDLLIGENDPIKALEQAEFYKNRTLTWILDEWKEIVLSPSYKEIRGLLQPNTAIVYWHLSDDALTTFILTPENPDPIVLPINRYQQSIALKKLIDEYKNDYQKYRQLPKDAKPEERANHPWRKNLSSYLDRLKQILDISAIEHHIGNAKQIILLPHRDLHLLPIHAGFADRFTCAYLPSIQIGLNQPNRQFDRAAPTLLNIDDPAVAGQPALIYSRLESAIVRTLFDQPTYLNGDTATHTATIAALEQPHNIFHFSGHGSYDEHRPENSAIGLTDAPLTAKTIAALDLTHYDLINLAACETGITGKGTIATEYVGLTSACLKARAGNVLSTLWQVDEQSSAWLTVRFYQAYLAGESAADALSIAQTWLQTITWADLATWLGQLRQTFPQMDYMDRLTAHHANILANQGKLESDQPPFAAPYYWAGFMLTGTHLK